MTLSILYRGPLSSCNYDCTYCPFAKHQSPPEELEADERALSRLVEWVADGTRRSKLSILFTPWGEALVRPWYRDAMVTLSHLPNVERVSVQTNLSSSLRFLDSADLSSIGLWTTYHPTEVTLERFVARCTLLRDKGVRFSVGIVGKRENLEEVQRLRASLPDDVYLWVNAYKSAGPEYYRASEVAVFKAIDPHFETNNVRHPSLGHMCRAGADAISVNGDGDIRRCHFVDGVLGNIYRHALDDVLVERPCPNDTCGCFIGYVHLDRLGLYDVFGSGILERVPDTGPLRHVSREAEHRLPILSSSARTAGGVS